MKTCHIAGLLAFTEILAFYQEETLFKKFKQQINTAACGNQYYSE